MKTNRKEASGKGTNSNKKMTRKDAISKAGFMAISAATTMMLLLEPNKTKAQGSAPAAPVNEPSGGGTRTKRTP